MGFFPMHVKTTKTTKTTTSTPNSNISSTFLAVQKEKEVRVASAVQRRSEGRASRGAGEKARLRDTFKRGGGPSFGIDLET